MSCSSTRRIPLPLVFTTLISVIPVYAYDSTITPTSTPTPTPTPTDMPSSITTPTPTPSDSSHISNHTDHDMMHQAWKEITQLDMIIGITLGGLLILLSVYLIYRYALRSGTYNMSSRAMSPPPSDSPLSSSSSSSFSTHIIDLEQPLLDQHNAQDVPLQVHQDDTRIQTV